MVDVLEHHRPTDDAHEPGVYRVVGATDDVALLRVTDADGRRVSTGELRRVAEGTLAAAFEPASDPDAGSTPVRDARNALSGLYWSFRQFF